MKFGGTGTSPAVAKQYSDGWSATGCGEHFFAAAYYCHSSRGIVKLTRHELTQSQHIDGETFTRTLDYS